MERGEILGLKKDAKTKSSLCEHQALVKNPAAETAGRLKIEYSFSVSFPQAKRACLSGRQVGNPSDKLSE